MDHTTNTLYPVFLKLNKLSILIVGGGQAGSEKLRFMMKNSPDANVELVAIDFSDEILQLKDLHPHILLTHGEFHENRLEGKDIVIIATDDQTNNSVIRDLAKSRGILTNVADDPELCDFYLGSIVTKGDLKVAISTNGRSPTFAKRFREVLEEILPEELPHLLENLSSIRDNLKMNFSEKVKALNKLTSDLSINNKTLNNN